MRSPAVTLLAACSFLIAGVVSAQTPADTTPRISAVSDPVLSVTKARALAIIPGAGHFYANESGRGKWVIGGMTGLMLFMSLVTIGDCLADTFEGSGDRCENPSSTKADVAAYSFIGVWAWSIYDAGHAARRTNARRSAASLHVGLRHYATASGRQTRAVRVGMRLAFR